MRRLVVLGFLLAFAAVSRDASACGCVDGTAAAILLGREAWRTTVLHALERDLKLR